MPMLMHDLLAGWRQLERYVDGLPVDDPRRDACSQLVTELAASYARLHDVWPRSAEDTHQVQQLIQRALEACAGRDASLEAPGSTTAA